MLGHLRGVNGGENGVMTYCMREEEKIIIDAFYLFLFFLLTWFSTLTSKVFSKPQDKHKQHSFYILVLLVRF